MHVNFRFVISIITFLYFLFIASLGPMEAWGSSLELPPTVDHFRNLVFKNLIGEDAHFLLESSKIEILEKEESEFSMRMNNEVIREFYAKLVVTGLILKGVKTNFEIKCVWIKGHDSYAGFIFEKIAMALNGEDCSKPFLDWGDKIEITNFLPTEKRYRDIHLSYYGNSYFLVRKEEL